MQSNVIILDKNWWKRERAPSKELTIRKRKSIVANQYFSAKEVAKRLNVGVCSIYDYIKSGELKCQIVGRRKRISMEDLEEFLILQNRKR